MCFITLTEHKIKKNQNHQHTIYKCKTNMVEKRIGWNRIVHSDTIFLGWPKYYLIKEDGFKEKKKILQQQQTNKVNFKIWFSIARYCIFLLTILLFNWITYCAHKTQKKCVFFTLIETCVRKSWPFLLLFQIHAINWTYLTTSKNHTYVKLVCHIQNKTFLYFRPIQIYVNYQN